MNRFNLIARLLHFRNDLLLLWRGFRDPATPLYLKGAMIAVVLYLVSPFDIIPDVLPFLGIADDLAIIALAVGWIAKRLPPHLRNAGRGETPRGTAGSGIKTVYGPARRK